MKTSKQKSGFKRLFALLVTAACTLTMLPVSSMTASAEVSYDPADFKIKLYVLDTYGARHYIPQYFSAGCPIWMKAVCNTLSSDEWEKIVYGSQSDYLHQQSNLTDLQFKSYNMKSDVLDYLRLTTEYSSFYQGTVYTVPDTDSDVYSGGYYGNLTESEEARNYLASHPLFTVDLQASFDDEHFRDFTYEELCDRTDYPTESMLGFNPVTDHYGIGWRLYFYDTKKQIDTFGYIWTWETPWELRASGLSDKGIIQHYQALFPDARLGVVETTTFTTVEAQAKIYAELVSQKESHYMIIEPSGGSAYSKNDFYTNDQIIVSGNVGEPVNYPSESFHYRRKGYKLKGWNVYELNKGAKDYYYYYNALTPTVLNFDSYWIAEWEEAPYQQYTVHYDANSEYAVGEMADETFDYNGNETFSYPNYYYPHHRFYYWSSVPKSGQSGLGLILKDACWHTESDGLPWDIQDLGQEFTVYAQWADGSSARYIVDIKKGEHAAYEISSLQFANYYTNEISNADIQYGLADGRISYMTYSGDKIMVSLKPYGGYELQDFKFETDHFGTYYYALDENGNGVYIMHDTKNGRQMITDENNKGMYDDLHCVKEEDGSYTVTFTMKNDHLLSWTPEFEFTAPSEYVDENGTVHNCTKEGISLTPVTPYDTEWTTGWYIVDGNTTLNKRPVIHGDVKLILCDGATLNAPRGIILQDDKNTLSIYGQKEGTGKIVAVGQDRSDVYVDSNGAYDQAGAGYDSAGIGNVGSGDYHYGNGGNLNIYGGIIDATSKAHWASGIGNGVNRTFGTIRIYGGTVRAKGDKLGAFTGKNITIADGLCVTYENGQHANLNKRYEAMGTAGQYITVSRCTHDDDTYHSVGGCKYCGESAYRTLTLTQAEHGTFTANVDHAPDGYGEMGKNVTLTFEPDYGYHVQSITITTENGSAITAEPENNCYSFIMPKVPVTVTVEWAQNAYTVSFDANGGSGNMETVSGLYGETIVLPTADFYAPEEVNFYCWCTEADGSGTRYGAGQIFTFEKDITLYAYWAEGTYLYYLDENGTVQTPNGDFTSLAKNDVEWNSGYYAAMSDVTIDARVQITGDVKLILCDGAELKVTKGINVPEDSSLTIYSQNADTGKLDCTGDLSWNDDAAAIGSEKNQKCGTITICGGNIYAEGGYYSAGIGSGEYGEYEAINIYGGNITAIGGSGAAGIGSGSWEYYFDNFEDNDNTFTVNNGTITIDGKRECTVNAYGTNDGAAGIGGGFGQDCGTIDISNATVNAVSGDFGTAIGNGMCEYCTDEILITDENGEYIYDEEYECYLTEEVRCQSYLKGGTIRIHSGNINAIGEYGGVGIGGGYLADDFGTVEISGGTIYAKGDGSETAMYEGGGAGIGGELYTHKGTIRITGGNITAEGSNWEYGFRSPGIGASEATVSISGGNITATGGDGKYGIDGIINIASPAVISGSINESRLTKDGIFFVKYEKSGADGEVPVPYYAPSGTKILAAEQGNLTKDDDTFTGWNTVENGTGTAYAVNEEITLNEDTTLYAQWQECIIINSANISLGGELGLNFYVTVPDSLINAGAKVVLNGPEGEKTVTLSNLAKDEKGRYKVSYKLKAVFVDKDVTLKITDSDNNTFDLYKASGSQVDNNTLEYSIYDYVSKAKSDTALTEKQQRMISTMYTYGAYSAKWKFGTETPDNVNSLPEIKKEDFAKYALKTDGTSGPISLKSLSLILDSNTAMRLYFTCSDDISGHSAKVKIGDSDVDLTIFAAKTAGKYYVEIDNIGANNLKKDYSIVFDNSFTATVSTMTYVYNSLKNGTATEDLNNVLKALCAYSDAVDDN